MAASPPGTDALETTCSAVVIPSCLSFWTESADHAATCRVAIRGSCLLLRSSHPRGMTEGRERGPMAPLPRHPARGASRHRDRWSHPGTRLSSGIVGLLPGGLVLILVLDIGLGVVGRLGSRVDVDVDMDLGPGGLIPPGHVGRAAIARGALLDRGIDQVGDLGIGGISSPPSEGPRISLTSVFKFSMFFAIRAIGEESRRGRLHRN